MATGPVPIISGESRLRARAATISALIVVAAFVAGKAGRDAILLSTFKVTWLPIFVVGSALLSFPIILITGKLLARHGPGRLIPILNVASAAIAIGEWSLLTSYPGPAAVAVFFHLSISGAVLVSGFWSIVNERFDVQAAKQHIGRIGMGATLGGILGGVIAERTAVYLSPEHILLVIAGLQLVSAIALSLFRGPPRVEPAVLRTSGVGSAVGTVARSGLLRNLAGVVILGAAAAGVLDYVFKADIVASSPHLLRSLAIFYTVTNALTAVVQVAIGGALIVRLGVPRSVTSLPLTVSLFGMVSLVVPTALVALLARGAELVVRNSIYRGAYELLYAPLSEDQKRPTKILLDVGADRIGDILGAQVVGILVYAFVFPRTGLLIAAVVAGLGAVAFAVRLRASYAASLQQSLIARTPSAIPIDPALVFESERWIRLRNAHTFGQAGDFPSLSLLRIPTTRPPKPVTPRDAPGRRDGPDNVVTLIAKLRSGDVAAIHEVLATSLTIETAPHVLDLIATDEVAPRAIIALTTLAPRITGMLVDALLDEKRELTMRRRLPAVIAAGDPEHAAWGLWRGLADPSFEIRYRCGVMLARQAASGWLDYITVAEVYAVVKRELRVDRETWTSYRLLEDDLAPAIIEVDGEPNRHPAAGTGLEHVFTLLGLVLPSEPLRIALRAVQTDDSVIRGTALEYLESILPAAVRSQLWPLIADEPDRIVERARMDVLARPKRSVEELVAELRRRSKARGETEPIVDTPSSHGDASIEPAMPSDHVR